LLSDRKESSSVSFLEKIATVATMAPVTAKETPIINQLFDAALLSEVAISGCVVISKRSRVPPGVYIDGEHGLISWVSPTTIFQSDSAVEDVGHSLWRRDPRIERVDGTGMVWSI
jgi:hypothetical protein